MPVDTRHREYVAHYDDWVDLRHFLAGERAVKAAATRYLPKLSDQTNAEYRSYLDRAVFFGALRRTLAGLVGLILSKAPEYDLGDAEDLRPGLDRITRDGEPLDSFVQDVLREVIAVGRFGALVDLPAVGGTPYLCGYTAESLVNWRSRLVDGRAATDQIVLFETYDEPAADGFGTEQKERYRELVVAPTEDGDRYFQRLYVRAVDRQGRRAGGWTIEQVLEPMVRGAPMREIPFVFFGPETLTPAVDRSPLLDICSLNKHHYRHAADLAHGRHYTALPVFYVTAPATREGVAYNVGPNRVWLIEPEGRAGILEFNGHGLQFIENATADLERQMAVLGARLIFPPRKTGSENPEIVRRRERGEHATLHTIVDTAERGLTQCLQWWVALQRKDPSGVRVRLNRDFEELRLEYRDVLQLTRMYQEGALPLDAFVGSLYEGDWMPTRMSKDEFKALLDDPAQQGEMPVKPVAAAKPVTRPTPTARS